ncbi:MAG: lamin tail domain-containing protein [Planctomycetota bacterium]|nr:lamin tail domain-containing protein [Planctomycetota bacterium]
MRAARRPATIISAMVLLGWILSGCGGSSGGESRRGGVAPPANHLLINEVFTGEPDFVEIYNPRPSPISLTGWTIRFYDTGILIGTYSFVGGTALGQNAALVLQEGSGIDNPPGEFFLGFDLPWAATFPLEVVLLGEAGMPTDYIAVNTDGRQPNLPLQDEFTGSVVQTPQENDICRKGREDKDIASDFRVEASPGTPGLANPGQGGTVFVVTPSLPEAFFDLTALDNNLNLFYSFALSAEGGTPPYHWKIVSGSLPSGLALDPITGIISGDPDQAGIADITIRATDSFTTPRSGFRNLQLIASDIEEGSTAGVLLNEVGTEQGGYAEILNPPSSGGVIDLGGWRVQVINDPGFVVDYVIPSPTLVGEGKVLVIREGHGAAGGGLIHAGVQFPWGTPGRGAAALFDPFGFAVDYLNWNNPFAPQQPLGVNWIGSVDAPGPGQALWRNMLSDGDSPIDWSVSSAGGGTPGLLNPGQ